MRFLIEFIFRCWCSATYRNEASIHDPQVIQGGHDALLNRQEPLA